jgi:N utilization substance protein A
VKIELVTLRQIEREKEIPFDELVEIIEQAIQSAYLRHAENQNIPVPREDEVRVTLDRKSGEISVLVPEVDEQGQVIGEAYVTTDEFGRVASSAAKQVINQRLRDLSDDAVLGTFKDKEGQIVSGVVQQGPNPRMVHVDLGELEAILPPEEQVPGEKYPHGARIRAEGIVEIVSLAREAGHRTKVAVRAKQPGINAKGTCIGEMGSRVRAVMSELGEEKIDIVDYSSQLPAFVANALSPAKVTDVFMLNESLKQVRALVPDFQLSLAIGKEGQNARLAAKLTGAKIDIQPDSIMND